MNFIFLILLFTILDFAGWEGVGYKLGETITSSRRDRVGGRDYRGLRRGRVRPNEDRNSILTYYKILLRISYMKRKVIYRSQITVTIARFMK